ncbi:O-antigen ligase family protein [Psychromonas sp. PT13]|uniref:O-antigen ligase family protein n=1 Tax=Psychromonas sp. PT13 TaxID=3439547 RepID=UPI003EBF0A8A
MFIINFSFVVDSTKRIRQLCWVIITAGLTQAIYAIFLQYSGWESSLLGLNIGDRASGSFVYQNHLANYLLLCLSIAIGYLIGSLEGVKATTNKQKLVSIIETLLSTKWVIRIAIIIMVVALIMTRSRMGNSAFFVSLLVSSVLALLLMKRPPNTLKWLIVSLIALDMVIVGTYFGVDKVKERLEATSFQSETRDNVVEDAMPYIKDYFIIGSGAGTFYSTFLQYQSKVYNDFYDHAHNEYVQFIVEFGVIPSFLMFYMILIIFWRAIKFLRQSNNNLSKGISIGTLMSCCCMIIHATVDFILQDFAIAILFITVLSLFSVMRSDKVTKI